METSSTKTLTDQYPGAERVLGVYPQKQQGLFMQRLKILGGRINWPQWRAVVELARRFSKRTSIHITTRQDIELHDIAGPDLQLLQKGLTEAGIAIQGAGGDSVRNITVCTGCRNNNCSQLAFQAAKFVYEYLADYPCDLPRKFKISFSGCSKACAKPWISDLGFIAQDDGNFTAIGAGSLGPRPGAGILLFEKIAAHEILPLCLAALDFFKEFGNRENRSRARLRHLREKLGDEQFKSQLAEYFGRMRSSKNLPDLQQAAGEVNLKLIWRLQLPNGNIGLDEAIQLADAAEPQGAELRINLEQGLELYSQKSFSLPENLASLKNLPVIISCPGLSSCSKGLTDTWATADEIRKSLSGLNNNKQLRICISGCPNGCAHSAAANIGLIGMLRNLDGRSVGCYRIFTGGHNGTDNHLANAVNVLSAEDAVAAVIHLML